jgi:hypothetical protein
LVRSVAAVGVWINDRHTLDPLAKDFGENLFGEEPTPIILLRALSSTAHVPRPSQRRGTLKGEAFIA